MSVNESEMETRIIMRRDSWYVRLGVLSAAGLLAFGPSDNIAGAVTANIAISQKNVIDQNVFYDSTKTTDEEDMNIQSAITASIAAISVDTTTGSALTATPSLTADNTQASTAPADGTQQNVQASAVPADGTQQNVQASTAPADGTQQGVQASVAPADGTQQNVQASAAPDQEPQKVSKQFQKLAISIAKDFVYVRKSASTGCKAIGKLHRGSAGTILGKKGAWVKISSGSLKGYVKKEYLATGADAEKLAEKYGTKYAVLKKGTSVLNVREEKNTSSDIVTQLPEGKRYTVKSENADWCKVKVKGKSGYVAKEYVHTKYGFKEAKSLKKKTKETVRSYASENKAESLISYAKQFIGNKYVWGGTSLTNGTDCSGFTLRVFQKFGYSLPRTSAEQAGCGSSVKLSELKPGDLVFYKRGGRVHHVAIYIGGGQIVHAAGAKWGIITSNMNYSRVSHARRILK
ncbi:MAG: hypothetical protein DBY27_02380 [Clostridiaceae bacterium]|nr:MAG: hypothetical protein DBY27_02380 [Clostridiaceae bacterium]